MNELKPYAGIALATGIVALFAVLAGQGAQVNEAYVDALFWMAIGGGIGATAVKARGPKFGPWIEGEPREYELRESAHPGELIPETFDDFEPTGSPVRIQMGPSLTPAEADEIRKRWIETHRGPGDQHEVIGEDRPHIGDVAPSTDYTEAGADGPEIGGVRPRMEARRPGEGEGDREGLGGR